MTDYWSSVRRDGFDCEQLDVKDERRVRRNHAVAGAADAVGEIGRNDEATRAADLHSRDALLPAQNHAPAAQRKRERLTAIEGAVELAAALVLRGRVKQPAGVMNDDDHARQRLVADPGDEVGDEHRSRRRRRGRGRRRRVRRLLRERMECDSGGRGSGNACKRVPHPSVWADSVPWGKDNSERPTEGTVPFGERYSRYLVKADAEGDSPLAASISV